MGLFDIFRVSKRDHEVDVKSGLTVSQDNQLAESLYKFLARNSVLPNKDNLTALVSLGYENNVDVYSIINYITTLHDNVEYKLVKEMPDKTLEPVEGHYLNDWLNRPNPSQSFKDLLSQFWTIYYPSGNGMLYVPRYDAGNNKGQIIQEIGTWVAPAHHASIITNGWREPIKDYIFDVGDITEKISADDILHVKYPSTLYAQNQNLMGMSPLRAAANLISSLNEGDKMTNSVMTDKVPTGILSKVDVQYSDDAALKEAQALKAAYRQKHKGKTEPIVTLGDVRWTPMSITSLKDLQTIESAQNGIRRLCNIYGVPSTIMNDISGRTFNNQNEAKKQTYDARVKPDISRFLSMVNYLIVSNYDPKMKIIADYSSIDALQEDKQTQITMLSKAVEAGLLKPKDAQEIAGFPIGEEPELDQYYLRAGIVPISFDVNIDESDKYLNANNINDYKYLNDGNEKNNE